MPAAVHTVWIGYVHGRIDLCTPTVVADPEGRLSGIYRDIARRVAAKLSQQKKDFSTKFPNIVIQNT